VHLRTGARPGEKMGTAKGWIAIGDRAYGILFAAGAVAVGGISMGGVAVGLIAIGGASVGLLAVGGFALGGLAMGGGAIGIVAAGGVATGLIGAEGGLAVAREFALGGKALAQHANDPAAREYFGQFPWMDLTKAGNRSWFLTLCWLPMLLVIWQGVRARKRSRRLAEQRRSCSEHSLLGLALLSLALFGTGCSRSPGDTSKVSALTLSNGLRVISVCFPASTNVSIFTFLTMGLTSDGPEQAQWSHLIEHLVIRSTTPANSPEANGETLPDHMRLDFYGNLANWKEGLSHHRRWLEGLPFTEASLAAEKPNVIAECDFAARNLASHKFAAAAWSHGLRHGKKHVALKADVKRAGLSDVQRLRDVWLVVSNQVTVCIVGGLQSVEGFAIVQKQLGGLSLHSMPPSAVKTTPQSLELTWDLDARHLLVAWPIPDCRQEDHAALMVAGQCLNMLLASDPQLTQQAGMIFAGSDLTTPEGNFFFVSASLRPGSTFAELCKTIQTHVGRLSSDAGTLAPAPFIASQLAASLTTLPDSELIKAQTPPGMSAAMIEGNLGLQLGMSEHRYGAHRPALARQLATVTAGKVQQVVGRHLTQESSLVCTLAPTPSYGTGN
jgi:predicted Zn-dependent peptidase